MPAVRRIDRHAEAVQSVDTLDIRQRREIDAFHPSFGNAQAASAVADFLQLAVVVDAGNECRRPSDADAESTAPERMEVRMKSILDPTFRYTSSANTDLRKTFARIRREARRQPPATPREPVDASKKITPIFRGQRPAA